CPAPRTQTAAGGAGRRPPTVAGSPAPGRDDPNHLHHRLPQEFKDFFASKGLDIEQYTRTLPESMHIGSPDGIHPRGYNDAWRQWIRKYGDQASPEDVLHVMHRLESVFGLPPMP